MHASNHAYTPDPNLLYIAVSGINRVDLLNEAARFAIEAKRARVAASQIRRLQEFLEGMGESGEAVLLLVAFIIRQVGRGALDKRFGYMLKDKIVEYYYRAGKESARVVKDFLRYLNWIYDAIERVHVPFDVARSQEPFIELVKSLKP